MRLGIYEIVIILIVLGVIALAVRLFRAKPVATGQSNHSSEDAIKRQLSEGSRRRWRYLRRSGIAFIAVGVLLLFTAISMFRWALQSYGWSLMMVVIGLAMLFLSRKR